MDINQNMPLAPQQMIEENDLSARSSPPVLQQVPYLQEDFLSLYDLYDQTEWYEPVKKRNIPMTLLEGVLVALSILFVISAIIVGILEENPKIFSDSEEYYATEESSKARVTLKLVDANGEDYKLPEDYYNWKLYYEQDNEVKDDSEYVMFFPDELEVKLFLSAGHYSATLVYEDYDEDEANFVAAESYNTSFDVPSTSTDISNGIEDVTVNVVIN